MMTMRDEHDDEDENEKDQDSNEEEKEDKQEEYNETEESTCTPDLTQRIRRRRMIKIKLSVMEST